MTTASPQRQDEMRRVEKTKSIRAIEEKLRDTIKDSLRYQALEATKDFKNSWIELGRALYTIWKDKLYRGWGFLTFDAYIKQELGIRKLTATKLLRSYYFLEQEEPQYLKATSAGDKEVAVIPPLESIDVLRQVKNKSTFDEHDYARVKEDVFERGKDVRVIKKELTALIRARKETDPLEAAELRRVSTIKRLLGTLKSIRQEIEIAKLLPQALITETAELIKKLEGEIS